MPTGGNDTLITVAVALIGAVGTAFSAWLYSRHQGDPMVPPGGEGSVRSQWSKRPIRDHVVVDVPPDPLDVETVTQMARRLRNLEDWRRKTDPVIKKMKNVLEWSED